ncbi:MAG: hypothetical protein ACI8TA_003264, partial [Cyclobacteriaceae bacterium]
MLVKTISSFKSEGMQVSHLTAHSDFGPPQIYPTPSLLKTSFSHIPDILVIL